LALADTHLARCLTELREASGRLVDEIATISAEAWDAPTNCPPWLVRDLAAHLVTSGQGFVGSIRRGLAGSTEPPPHGASTQLREADPVTVAQAFAAVTQEFVSLYSGLTDAQLDTICWHRRGNRSVRWYATHRLAEVAFHGWDLRTSLGRRPVFEVEVARLLLPTLLESNVPRTYAAGLSTERGRGERYALRVAEHAQDAWLVTIEPEVLRVEPGGQDADVRITATADVLALLVYGRATLDQAHVEGDPGAIERFARIFPRP
jgi:uncharacterized protein (TIGR03083 family)